MNRTRVHPTIATLQSPLRDGDHRPSRQWGDFQTPPQLAVRVCRYLLKTGVAPRIIIEPTHGEGNFILAALESFPTTEVLYGVEIQGQYHSHVKTTLLINASRGHCALPEIELHQDDIFTHRFPNKILKGQDILIIGNPPWVTSAELGALEAHNLPAKSNIKALNGIDALTGKSNFDLGEYVLLRILELFSGQRGTLAMLCKNSVIKNILELLPQRQLRVSNIRALQIDASREFGAAVNASLLVMDMGVSHTTYTCQIAPLDRPRRVARVFGWTRNKFVSDIQAYESASALDGQSPLIWRQGLKHDCARIMELDAQGDLLFNGNSEVVDVEDQWLYWLVKSSDLRSFETDRVRRKVIVTQHRLGQDTSNLQKSAPKLWEYLLKNGHHFERRKSRIYCDKPRFSIFGVGEYSFKPYKVAVSGLYKEPCFSLLPPINNRPLMLDDTCYFLGFDTYLNALFTASLLNTPLIQRFLRSIAFVDAKRPYTKTLLMRIDLTQAASRVSFQELLALWPDIGYEPRILPTKSDWQEYRKRLSSLHKAEEELNLDLDMELSLTNPPVISSSNA